MRTYVTDEMEPHLVVETNLRCAIRCVRATLFVAILGVGLWILVPLSPPTRSSGLVRTFAEYPWRGALLVTSGVLAVVSVRVIVAGVRGENVLEVDARSVCIFSSFRRVRIPKQDVMEVRVASNYRGYQFVEVRIREGRSRRLWSAMFDEDVCEVAADALAALGVEQS